MTEQSHRDEMNAAIRAQRERSAVPKTIALEPQAAPPPPHEAPEPGAWRGFVRRRRRGPSPS
jgi:hypothetical protein